MGFRDYISGHKRKIKDPNFFGAGTVGGGWSDYLKGLYATPTGESDIFKSQSSALRDALTVESDTQKDEFGLAANSGGFYDSGARLTGLGEINRNKMFTYTQGLSQILAKLESDKMEAAAPFLSAQIGGWQAFQNALYQQDELQTQRKKQIAQTVGSIFGSASSMGGGGGSVQSGGGGGGGGYSGGSAGMGGGV